MAQKGNPTLKKSTSGRLLTLFDGNFSWISFAIVIGSALAFVYLLQSIVLSTTGKCISVRNLSTMVTQSDPEPPRQGTDLTRMVFNIAAATKNWPNRKNYIKPWYNLNKTATRAIVWLDRAPNTTAWDDDAPPFKVSEDISTYGQFNKRRITATRIARIVTETIRLELPDVDWYVFGDDDTVFLPENLARVLSRHNHREMRYVGGHSETHSQNLLYSYSMAFGGGGFALSAPMAAAVARSQDACLARYKSVFGSDERVYACVSELGVALTRELGFHQMDLQGNPRGFLAAHPLAPLVSLHHLDLLLPLFPHQSRHAAAARLINAALPDQASILQQSFCYSRNSSLSVSWGYVVEIYPGFLPPRVLETPLRTFTSVKRKGYKEEFPFNTREVARDPCSRPDLYFMTKVKRIGGMMESVYARETEGVQCARPMATKRIRVFKEPVAETWFEAPRRSCCKVEAWSEDTIELRLRECQAGETLVGGVY